MKFYRKNRVTASRYNRHRRITASMSDAQLYRELQDVIRYMDNEQLQDLFRLYVETPHGSKYGRMLWRYGTAKAERELIDQIVDYIISTGDDLTLEDIGNVLNGYYDANGDYDDDDIY